MNYTGNQLENELDICRKQIADLKKENEELLRNLYKVNEKLRDSEALKGHFISNITNEIVNPFTSVMTLAENIRQLKEGDIAYAHKLAELIHDEAFHLDFQLKNIFAAALIESGKEEPKITHIRISDLGPQIRQYFHSQLGKKNVMLEIALLNQSGTELPETFVSDKEKIDLIVKNLVSNAIKYSPEESVVNLNFLIGKGFLHIEVTDRGKGITENDRNLVFDRFKQLDEKINSINTGHGLGLSVVQAYAELLGGKVVLSDSQPDGFTIAVTIPESAGVDDWDDLEDFLLDPESL